MGLLSTPRPIAAGDTIYVKGSSGFLITINCADLATLIGEAWTPKALAEKLDELIAEKLDALADELIETDSWKGLHAVD